MPPALCVICWKIGKLQNNLKHLKRFRFTIRSGAQKDENFMGGIREKYRLHGKHFRLETQK